MRDALPDALAASIAFRRTSSDAIVQEASLEMPLGYAPAAPEHPPSIAVVLHAFHLDLLPEIAAYLDHIPFAADLFVSTVSEAARSEAADRLAGWRRGGLEIRVFPNRGRDIAPKLVGFVDVYERYEYVLHLHTKMSSHQSELAGWRGYILETLLGSPDVVRGVFEAFRQAPWLGILAPQHIDMLRPWIGWGINLPHAKALAARMGLELSEAAPIDFPSGSMFWARSAALRRITGLGLRFEDFPAEEGQTDGTPAHAIERLYFLACEAAGFGWMKIAARGQLFDQHAVTAITRPVSLAPFLSRCSVRLTSWQGEAERYRSDPGRSTPYPSPRRVSNILWRRMLGTGLPLRARRRVALVLPREAGQDLLRSARRALERLPPHACGVLLTMPGSARSTTDSRNEALRTARDIEPDMVVLVRRPGLLHPDSLAALVEMSEAQGGVAMLAARCFPALTADANPITGFTMSAATGPVIAIPRAIVERLGGFDERLRGYHADLDFSWRATAHGFAIRCCPRALFLAAPEDLLTDPASGVLLAEKWGNATARGHFVGLLAEAGQAVPSPHPEPVSADWRRLADFAAHLGGAA
jgi:hypothetical protein